ncbi:ABC transporter substrate-binding protein [Pseudoduganella lutea]|uniref:Probable sugar-binding periplasmic protein n=1 Tax=Pseudoduganella lutea TaxID=321985 RepID=A0A4P6L5P5_9BURK|nr:ABC transporter substrate-binding protein [Pseudoduganella lutea]QBE66784.1 carbohydrate ABC transporter substrate-binding protein [Pseudoduganella lutea]
MSAMTAMGALAVRSVLLLAALLPPVLPSAARAGEVEVLHFWASGGEAQAVAQLKATLRANGHTWKDFAIADGGGGLAVVMLDSRVRSGNPPTAAQIKGVAIQEWARTGKLSGIEDVASAERWNAVLPRLVSDTMKYRGHYVAAPLNVHRVNWLWINAAVLRKAGAKVPATWDEFFAAAEAIRRAGITPVAYGGQSWLDMGTFESVAIGVGGVDFYKKAFLELDRAALGSPAMEKTLQTYRRLKSYTDQRNMGRDWVAATAMLNRGAAGMLIMGDWAKAEMLAAGKRPGTDILCTPTPGSREVFSFDIDSIVLFDVAADKKAAQRDLARAVMGRDFQQAFNLAKGSIPARLDVPLDRFDACARRARQDFQHSARRGTLLPSVAHGMAHPAHTVAPLWDVVQQFWNQDRMTPREAMARLVAAAGQKPAAAR